MGRLIEGVWYDQWYDTKSTGGRFQRQESAFRRWLGTPEFPAECGRYHLYVSLACPWAHRTLICRQLTSGMYRCFGCPSPYVGKRLGVPHRL